LNDWIDEDKHFFSYDDNNNLLTDLYQIWKDDDWLNMKKETYVYENNILVKDMLYNWSGATWEIIYENEYGFDSNSKQISTENYRWIEDNKKLQKKRTFKYDDFQNLNLVLFEEGDTNNLNPEIDYIQFNDYLDRKFSSGGYKIEIFWGQTTTPVINETEYKHNISCYPNPVSETTNISFSLENESYVSLQITNTLGQVVGDLITNKFMESGEHSFDFDANNLPSGLYFVCLKVGGYTLTEKLIVSQ